MEPTEAPGPLEVKSLKYGEDGAQFLVKFRHRMDWYRKPEEQPNGTRYSRHFMTVFASEIQSGRCSKDALQRFQSHHLRMSLVFDLVGKGL